MNLLGRPATASIGAVLAAGATLATIKIVASSWTGCDSHLEPGSPSALNALLPVCFTLVAAGGALAGRLTRWTGLRTRIPEDPEFVRLLAVVAGIATTAVALTVLLAAPAQTCPLGP
ncbi:hypothetical protein ACFV4P_29520 [Kitasatospora sp. NPDC059795]|uniref:hypothetical protein n=1 Tax=Kitasatospora sp. NPDC059795 TaxID=3346949 RepID=UPI00364E4E83